MAGYFFPWMFFTLRHVKSRKSHLLCVQTINDCIPDESGLETQAQEENCEAGRSF
jgi:hypothetical protein